MEARDKQGPRENRETPVLTVSLAPQDRQANVTPASAPTTPASHTDPTPKTSRGLKHEAMLEARLYELGHFGLNQELLFPNHLGGER